MAERAVFVPAGMEPDEKAVKQLDMCLADERAVAGDDTYDPYKDCNG